jgi:hypothetical protein
MKNLKVRKFSGYSDYINTSSSTFDLRKFEQVSEKNIEEIFQALNKNPNIKILDLRNNPIEDAAVKKIILHLKENKNLENVLITPENVTPTLLKMVDDLCAFNILSSLISSTIRTNKLRLNKQQLKTLTNSTFAIETLQEILPHLEPHAVDFSDNNLCKNDRDRIDNDPLYLSRIFPFITENTISLNLANNSLSETETEKLKKFFLKSKSNIEYLNLNSNILGDNGLQHILESIPMLTHLNELHVSNNKITFDNTELSNLLEKSKIETLSLSGNIIKFNLGTLFRGLPPEMKTLYLADSKLDNLKKVVNALSANSTLKKVVLNDNLLKIESENEFLAFIKATQLREFHIIGNQNFMIDPIKIKKENEMLLFKRDKDKENEYIPIDSRDITDKKGNYSRPPRYFSNKFASKSHLNCD